MNTLIELIDDVENVDDTLLNNILTVIVKTLIVGEAFLVTYIAMMIVIDAIG